MRQARSRVLRGKFAAAVAPCSLLLLLATSPARAHEAAGEGTAAPSTNTTDDTWTPPKLRWHGSTILFDQSATIQTIGIGADYQTYNPTYELWFAFLPQFYLYETPSDSISLHFWANVYLELTNSDTTTLEREPLLGPSYLWGTYAHTFFEQGGYKTTLSTGPRMVLPTDKAARDTGQLFGLGATAAVSQSFPLAGKDAPAFNGARLGFTTTYTHTFNRSTTMVSSDLDVPRQGVGIPPNPPQQVETPREDIGGRTIPSGPSDILTGRMQVHDSLWFAFSGSVRVLPKVDLSLSYWILTSYAYLRPDAQICTLLTGCAEPTGVDSPTNYRVRTWLTASIGYDVIDEMSISLGYYNLADQTGPDGTRRSPLWSPSARVFLTLVGKLDAIYERFAPQSSQEPATGFRGSPHAAAGY